ncbi:hypothetical protein VE00_04473 [Pseudogymnoascus sp. WSF 3629]|nr:hypothetical protein VE00_04473 [Pseudogymnoascus sp. WSF 3629]
MELNDNRPTDAEAWAYLFKHGDHITETTHKLPKKIQNAIAEVLQGNWDAEVVDRINIHDFGLIWSDKHYKKLATKLRNGPAAEAFNIEILNTLKTYRLEGYWDVLLEDAADWLRVVFKKSMPRVLTKELFAITMCGGVSNLDYLSKLCNLFWVGGETHKAGIRKEEFLSHLSITEYSEAYNIMRTSPWDPRWNFPGIVREIREFAEPAKKVMVHVAFWYNPELKEPHSRESNKKPVHHHLKQHFRKSFPQNSNKDADKAWKSKAIALQQVVVDFTMENGKILRGPYMVATSRFNQAPEEYNERFRKDTFWDRLALRIRDKMPEIPFQHPDLLPYNSTGNNIYHSDYRRALGITSPARPEGDVSPIADLATRDPVAPEIEDLIGQKYPSCDEELSDPGLRASTSAENRQTTSVSTYTNHLGLGKDNQWEFNEEDETVDLDTNYSDTSSHPPPSRSSSLRKRKTPSGFTPRDSHRHKLARLKLQHTAVVGETATGPSASTSGGQKSPIGPISPPQRPKMDTNLPEDRESIRLPSQPPPLTAPRAPMFSEAPEEIPPRTAEIPRAEPAPSEGRQMPPPGVAAPTANIGEPVHSASLSAPARTIEISQAGPALSNEVKQAVEIMLDEFADKLNRDEQVVAMEDQVATMGEQISDMTGQIEDTIERVNAIDEQVAADKLNMEKQAAANKLNMEKQALASKLDINEQVTAIKKQVHAEKLHMKEQVAAMKGQIDAMKKQVEADNTKEQIAIIKKQVDADKLDTEEQVAAMTMQVDADKLDMEEQVAAMKDQVNVMKNQFDVDKLAMNEQVATLQNQVGAIKEKGDTEKLDMKETVDAMKEQVATIEGQVKADKLNMNKQVDAMKEQVESNKFNMENEFNVERLYINEQVAAMKEQVETDKFNMEKQFDAERIYMKEQVDAMKDQVDAMKEQFASIKPTKISQAEQPSKIVLDAIDIVNDFLDELNIEDQIVTVNAVLRENIALVFLRLSTGVRKAWLYDKIGVNRDE